MNTQVPHRPGTEGSETDDAVFIVDYDVATGNWRIIRPLIAEGGQVDPQRVRYVGAVGWLVPGKELLVAELGGQRAPSYLAYTLKANRWVNRSVSELELANRRVDTEPHGLKGIAVTVEQSANDPPVVVASDGRQKLALTGPDPALEDIWRARMETVQWSEPDGARSTGGLLLPRNATKGKPLPLVIQAYYYHPDYFLPDGRSIACDAAQALVARGMAVLQINISIGGNGTQQSEGERFVARVDAAVESLAARELIDPKRVGLSGFSRAGYQVFYAITHPGRISLAASVASDSFKGSYSSYLTASADCARNQNVSLHFQRPAPSCRHGGEFEWDADLCRKLDQLV